MPAFLEPMFTEHGDAALRGVVFCDELDKIAVRDAHQTSKDHRLGQQKSLLPLFGVGSAIPRPFGRSIRPDGMLIIGTGVFVGLPQGILGPADLRRLGFIDELVERFGSLVRLSGLAPDELARMLAEGLSPCHTSFEACGFTLLVRPETLRYAAAMVTATVHAGPRSAVTWLRAAADRLLINLRETNAALGTRVELRPDDVVIPLARPSEGPTLEGGDVGT